MRYSGLHPLFGQSTHDGDGLRAIVKIRTFGARNGFPNHAFAMPPNRPLGGLKNHQKIPFIQ
jgi:hypothetical protein